jgi:hypothetical protein
MGIKKLKKENEILNLILAICWKDLIQVKPKNIHNSWLRMLNKELKIGNKNKIVFHKPLFRKNTH